jgi:hypothetical protein
VYRGPIDELSKGTALTRTAIESLSRDVNDLTVRNRAWVAASKSERFGDRELAPIVSPAFVSARVAGITMIERLASRMLRVVDSQASADASAQVVTTAGDVKTFAETIDPSGPVKDYAAPLGGLSKVVIDIYGDLERQAILEKAIKQGIPAAKKVLAVLERDYRPGSTTSIDAVKLEELRTLKSEQISTYDRLLQEESQLPPAERGTLARVQNRYAVLERIITTQRILDGTANDSVYQTLLSLDASLDALLAVATRSEVSPRDLGSLAQELATFSSNAASLLDAVRAVRDASASPPAPQK